MHTVLELVRTLWMCYYFCWYSFLYYVFLCSFPLYFNLPLSSKHFLPSCWTLQFVKNADKLGWGKESEWKKSSAWKQFIFIFMHPVLINLVSLENVCHIFYAQAIRSHRWLIAHTGRCVAVKTRKRERITHAHTHILIVSWPSDSLRLKFLHPVRFFSFICLCCSSF